MVYRERLINKLGEMGFLCTHRGKVNVIEFKNQATMRRAYVPRKDLIDDDLAGCILVNAGLDAADADEFVTKNQAPN